MPTCSALGFSRLLVKQLLPALLVFLPDPIFQVIVRVLPDVERPEAKQVPPGPKTQPPDKRPEVTLAGLVPHQSLADSPATLVVGGLQFWAFCPPPWAAVDPRHETRTHADIIYLYIIINRYFRWGGVESPTKAGLRALQKWGSQP